MYSFYNAPGKRSETNVVRYREHLKDENPWLNPIKHSYPYETFSCSAREEISSPLWNPEVHY